MKKGSAGENKIRVVAIWHAAVVDQYRKRYVEMAKDPRLDITLLIPYKWREGETGISYHKNREFGSNLRVITAGVYAKNNIRRYFFTEKFFKIMRDLKPHVLDIYEEPFSYVFLQAILYKATLFSKAKIVFHSAHNTDNFMGYNFELLKKIGLRFSAAGICRNRESIELYRKWGFKKKIYLIGNSIDMEKFYKKDARVFKKEKGIGKNAVGYIGRILKAKGLDTLISAANKITERKLHLCFVGDGKYKEEFRRNTEKLANMHKISFFPHISNDTVNEYLNALDVLVLPSCTTKEWKESFGRILIEAMKAETPVIGSNSGNIPLTIDGAGLIFPEGDAFELKKAILTLLDNKKLREKLIEKGRKRAADFSIEKIASVHKQVYFDICS